MRIMIVHLVALELIKKITFFGNESHDALLSDDMDSLDGTEENLSFSRRFSQRPTH